MAHICERCKTEIHEGGLFYQVRLSAASGYDGVMEEQDDRRMSELLEETVGKTQEELEEAVYFEREVILCAECRRDVIASFQREIEIGGRMPSTIPEDRLH